MSEYDWSHIGPIHERLYDTYALFDLWHSEGKMDPRHKPREGGTIHLVWLLGGETECISSGDYDISNAAWHEFSVANVDRLARAMDGLLGPHGYTYYKMLLVQREGQK